MKSSKLTLAALGLATLLMSCSTVSIMDDEGVYDDETPTTVTANESTDFDADAYEKGVRDVLHDMRGRLAANNDYVFMPPIKECGVWIPSRVINGVVIPAHETCVVYAPGYYVEKNRLFQVEGVKP